MTAWGPVAKSTLLSSLFREEEGFKVAGDDLPAGYHSALRTPSCKTWRCSLGGRCGCPPCCWRSGTGSTEPFAPANGASIIYAQLGHAVLPHRSKATLTSGRRFTCDIWRLLIRRPTSNVMNYISRRSIMRKITGSPTFDIFNIAVANPI